MSMNHTAEAVDYTIKPRCVIQVNTWDVDLELTMQKFSDTGYSSCRAHEIIL